MMDRRTAVGFRRRLSVGVEVGGSDRAHARVWAPACRTVDVVVDGSDVATPLEREPDGHFSGIVEGVGDSTRYWYRLDGDRLRPDPASRYQPDGPHGPSQIVDPARFVWTDGAWRGPVSGREVLYEMHVGTFTREGTWRAAARELEELASLGITVVEMMPVADFPGRWGWGYDGVNLFAPTRLYGTPDDLRAFVDRAHALGIAAILDVVYNHFGPDGNYIGEFSPDYFTRKYKNDWGLPINFEGPVPVREFFVQNAGYWVDEFHFDGLRLDATQDIQDASPEHVMATMVRRAREAAGGRRVYVIAENEPQRTQLVRPPAQGGFGADALWNDDYHHTAVVALTGRREAYYRDYTGTPQEFVSSLKYGYLYQGQWYAWQGQRRGTRALDLPHRAFVHFLENHDQVANSARGRRLHQLTSPGLFRALTTLTLLGPQTPLLFQGQEFSSSAPFVFFVDHRAELRRPIHDGRLEFLSQFASLKDPEAAGRVPSPADDSSFYASKLDLAERDEHADVYALHRDLLALRRDDPVIGSNRDRFVDGAVLTPGAFAIRYFGGEAGDRLLIVNLQCDTDLTTAPEPLIAPPDGAVWDLIWCSESARYGGGGVPATTPEEAWHIPGQCALVYAARPRPEGRPA